MMDANVDPWMAESSWLSCALVPYPALTSCLSGAERSTLDTPTRRFSATK